MSAPTPLSPSQQPNALPIAPASTSTKPSLLEEDDDFYTPDDVAIEPIAPLSPSSAPTLVLPAGGEDETPVASSSKAAWTSAVEAELRVEANGAKAGLVLEEDEDMFEADDEAPAAAAAPASHQFWGEASHSALVATVAHATRTLSNGRADPSPARRRVPTVHQQASRAQDAPPVLHDQVLEPVGGRPDCGLVVVAQVDRGRPGLGHNALRQQVQHSQAQEARGLRPERGRQGELPCPNAKRPG